MTGNLSSNKLIVAGFLCVMFYAVLFALQAASDLLAGIPVLGLVLVVPVFESPMYWAMPFFGFFAVFLLVDWINDSFKTRLGLSPVFPIAFFFLALFAYYVSLYWYISNFASLQGVEMSLELVDFWGKLRISAYKLFLWSGVFGWAARYAVEKINL